MVGPGETAGEEDSRAVSRECGKTRRMALTHELENQLGRGNSKWSGLCVGLDQRLYCVPYNSSDVLAISGRKGVHGKEAGGCTRTFSRHRGAGVGVPPGMRGNLAFSDLLSVEDPLAPEKTQICAEFVSLVQLEDGGKRVTKYRELCRKYHPDKHGPDGRERATTLFQFLQNLHESCDL